MTTIIGQPRFPTIEGLQDKIRSQASDTWSFGRCGSAGNLQSSRGFALRYGIASGKREQDCKEEKAEKWGQSPFMGSP